MNVLSLSGGATKFIAIMAAARELIEKRGFRPDVIVGVSSGSIVGALSAMKLFDVGVTMGLELRLNHIFSSSPVTERGTLTIPAIARAIGGMIFPNRWNYLGRMDNLEKLLRSVITPSEFAKYQFSTIAPPVYVLAVNAADKSRMTWNIKNISYDTAIAAIMASCTMPIVAPAVEIDGQFYYDGGVRDHSPGSWFCDYAGERFQTKKIVSIYSRPENFKLPVTNKWRKNVLTTASDFLLNTYNIEISKNDEWVERSFCERISIPYMPIFIEPFAENLFDVRPENLHRGMVNGMDAVNKYYKPKTNPTHAV